MKVYLCNNNVANFCFIEIGRKNIKTYSSDIVVKLQIRVVSERNVVRAFVIREHQLERGKGLTRAKSKV